jgi:protocatechuate 3,4-dioxygenase beta subunit
MMSRYLDVDPPYRDPNYRVTVERAPLQPAVRLPKEWFHHVKGPVFGQLEVSTIDSDLTAHGKGQPIGMPIEVFGRVSDSDGKPVRNALIEIWQANAAGGYVDSLDITGFPLDPNFIGAGRCLTDEQGNYRFRTIRPGAYPAMYSPENKGWRAAHIHFSLFGPGFESRLVTQMYFEGDPLLRQDVFVHAIPDPRGREALIAKWIQEESRSESFGPPRTEPTVDGSGILIQPPKRNDAGALLARNPAFTAYRFDIVLRGRGATPFEG